MNVHPPDPQTTPAEAHAALFANLVLQQTNMALMFLGKIAGPDGKAAPKDLEAASLFIDTLEMLAAKTRGNLDAHEQEFIQQSLTTLRMYYVEAVSAPPAGGAASAPVSPAPAPATGAPAKEESPKRFSKKY
jgi:hypothetical protein